MPAPLFMLGNAVSRRAAGVSAVHWMVGRGQ